jgi:SAM-dependent methyltransferase
MELYTVKNSVYLEKNKSWHIEDSPWKAKQILSIMQKNNINPQSIVEIGCGAGEILKQLKNMMAVKDVLFSGYDISPDAATFWKERQDDRLHFYQENLLVTTSYYDLLLMIDVFEHVEDYFLFIKASNDKAKYKIYHIPLDISVVSVIRNKLIDSREKVGHLHHYMKDTALATLKDCGQEIIDYAYTSAALDATDKKVRTKILNVFRKFLFNFNQDLTVRLFGGYSLIVLTK